jgi:ABC-2 type transport system permease protein
MRAPALRGPARSAPALRTMALVLVQLRYEQRVFWRNIGAAFFTFAFPVLLFVLFAALFARSGESALGGVKGIQYYTPVIAAYGVMSACFVSPALTVTFRRETGLLKKVRGSALPPASYFGGLAGSAVVNAAIIVALILLVGGAGYGARMPADWPAFVISLLVGAAAFCCLGLAVSALIPNFDAAPAVVNLIFLVLLVISGGFFPIAPSSVLGQIAQVFPLQHLLLAAYAAFTPATGPASATAAFPWWHVAVVAAWGAAAFAFALRCFRWTAHR